MEEHAILSHQFSNKKSASAKKHGFWKRFDDSGEETWYWESLMIVWWATYPVGGDISTGNGYTDREVVVSPSQHLNFMKYFCPFTFLYGLCGLMIL